MTSVSGKLYISNQNASLLDNLSPQQQHCIVPTRIRRMVPPASLLNKSVIINRLKQMVQKNIAYNGGLSEMSRRNFTDALNKKHLLFTGKVARNYNKLQRAINDADTSMRKLEKHPVGDFSPNFNPPKYEAAIEDLQQAIKAQYTLKRALRIYGKTATGDMSKCCILRADDCERRISEMLNVVSQAHIPNPQRNHLDLTKNIAVSMNEVAPDMHGTPQALQEIYAEADALFYELDTLEQQNVVSGSYNYKLLQYKILKLQAKLTSILSQNVSDEKFKITYDAVLLDGFNNSLTSALKRCNAIATPNISEVQEHAIQDLIQPTIDALTEINNHIQHISVPRKDAVAYIINYTKQIKSNLQAKAAQTDSLSDLSSINTSIQTIVKYIYEWLDYIEHRVDENTFQNIISGIGTTIYSRVGYDIFSTGLNELAEITAKNNPMNHDNTGAYLAQAFYNSSGIDALTECYVRGIPPQYIEKESSEKRLLDDRTLGAGGANEVTLCVYKAPHGQNPIEKVFKPEYSGRYGLSRLCVHRMDGNDFTHLLVRNIASSEVAKYLGCPNIVSSATAGTHKNQFGLFMNKAPGKTPLDLATPNKNNKCDLEEAISTSISHGNFNIMKANLRRELSNLEWADVLSGQIDRHNRNYLVDIDELTGAVTVTGIDNDASFSTAMTGVGIISVNNLNISPEERAELEPYFFKNSLGKLYFDGHGSPIINMSMIDNIGQAIVINIVGVNQKMTPDIIDQKTYNALMAIDETKYAETLKNLLPPENVQVALKRLDAAKKHATELHQQHRVINNWQDPIVEDYYNKTMQNYEDKVNNGINYPNCGGLELPFYLRDFHYNMSTAVI